MDIQITLPMISIEEDNEISNLIRNNKFKNFENILYYNNPVEACENFTKCYRLMLTVISFLDKKLNDYIINLNDINDKINVFLIDLNHGFKFNKNILNKKINIFYIDNRITINNLIDFVYKYGKVVRQFDINENQGYT